MRGLHLYGCHCEYRLLHSAWILLWQETTQKLLEAEEDQTKRDGEKRELQQALEMVKENADRQVRELEQENIQLNQVIEVSPPLCDSMPIFLMVLIPCQCSDCSK